MGKSAKPQTKRASQPHNGWLKTPDAGFIYCCDLADPMGRIAAEALVRQYADVRDAMRTDARIGSDRLFLLALAPTSTDRVVTVITATETLHDAIHAIIGRSLDFGAAFSVAITPPDAAIKAVFDRYDDAAGHF